jgi:hypothetical protein
MKLRCAIALPLRPSPDWLKMKNPARLRSSSYARALAIAVAICVATRSKKLRYNSSSFRCALIPATKKPASSSGMFERIGTTTA